MGLRAVYGRARQSLAWQVASDVGTAVFLMSLAVLALGVLSHWAAGPLRFLDGLAWYWYVGLAGTVFYATLRIEGRRRSEPSDDAVVTQDDLDVLRTQVLSLKEQVEQKDWSKVATTTDSLLAESAVLQPLRLDPVSAAGRARARETIHRLAAEESVARPPVTRPRKPDLQLALKKVQANSRESLAEVLSGLVQQGLTIYDQLPTDDPDGLAAARAVARGEQPPPDEKSVGEWENAVVRYLEGSQRKTESAQFMSQVSLTDNRPAPLFETSQAVLAIMSPQVPVPLRRRMSVRLRRLTAIIRDLRAES